MLCTEHNHPPDQASNKAKKLVSSMRKGQYSLSDYLDTINIKLNFRQSTCVLCCCFFLNIKLS